MNEERFIVGIGQGDHEYTVNGVKYIVNPVFRPFDFKNFKDTLAEAVEKYLKNDLAEWTNDEYGGIMSTECVSTAGNGGRSEPENRSNRTFSCSDPQFAKANCPMKGGKI